ncbi:MAG: S8 family peptidase [Acidimicrobiales bacterium]
MAVVLAVLLTPVATAAGATDDSTPADGTDVIVSIDEGADPAVVAAEVSAAGGEIVASHEGALTITLDEAAAEELPSVTSVEPVVTLVPMLSDSTQVIRANVARAAGHTGAGRRIVIIDTGIDPSTPGLDGRVVAGACFTSDSSCPNFGDQDTSGPAAGAPCTGHVGNCAHGTRVALVAASSPSGGASPGVAPGAEIISINVFDTNGQQTNSTQLLRALQWVRQNQNTLRADVINISLGDPDPRNAFSGSCDAFIPALAAETQRLRDAGVATVIAAGNSSLQTAVAVPACLSPAVAVAATTTADTVADYSNRGSLGTLAAPGNVTVDGVSIQGTSFAAPHVAGAWALQRAQQPGISVTAAERRFRDRAVRITDPATGLQMRRIDVAANLGLRSPAAIPPAPGAWVVTSTGRVIPRGQARSWGSVSPSSLAPGERVVASTPTVSGIGYWVATDRGRVVPFGDARFFGDARSLPLNQPITAMAVTPSGAGYWLLAADGGVFTYGDARFYGSTGGLRLNARVTDMAVTPSGNGYWFTALDGGVFSFGDAKFYGSTGGIRLNQPVVSIAAGPSVGYWLVALDGGIFAFSVPFHGSLPGVPVNETGLRIRGNAGGRGYQILTAEGSIYRFGVANSFAPARPFQPGETPADLMLLGG